MKRILFVTYGGGHAQMVGPVVNALRGTRAGSLDLRVLGLPAAKATLRRHGVESFGFGEYLRGDARARAWGESLAREHHSPTIGADLEESVAYLGLCYQDLVVRLGEAEAARRLAEHGRQAFHPLTVLERILDDLRPDVVVATNSPRSEAAAIEVAGRRGLDTLIMTDLFSGFPGYRLRARSITFLNERAKEMFVSDGLIDASSGAFYLTGNPAFDRLLDLPTEKDPGWIGAQYPQAQGRPLILHADMPAYWDPLRKRSHRKTEEEILEELAAAHDAARSNGALYLVRPHPSQDRAFYEAWVRERPDAVLADGDLHELIRNVDLVLVRSTTVGLEAAYLGQRVLQLDADLHTDLPLAGLGLAWGVNSYGALPAEIHRALTDAGGFRQIRKRADEVLPREPAAPKIADLLVEKPDWSEARCGTKRS